MKTSLIVLSVFSLMSSSLWAVTEATSDDIQGAKIACQGSPDCREAEATFEKAASSHKTD